MPKIEPDVWEMAKAGKIEWESDAVDVAEASGTLTDFEKKIGEEGGRMFFPLAYVNQTITRDALKYSEAEFIDKIAFEISFCGKKKIPVKRVGKTNYLFADSDGDLCICKVA